MVQKFYLTFTKASFIKFFGKDGLKLRTGLKQMCQIVFSENSKMSVRLTNSVILREHRFLASTDTKVLAIGRETELQNACGNPSEWSDFQ
ncbi:MAG TPA: hypothetical protein DCE56_15415 [Cyanobacteria bacterium UBA8553]|nr:hypothetical protein [Cyanobacteria bacterium UBA8553]